MIERRRLSKPKSMEAAAIQRMTLFGAASLLPGEDSAAYDLLLAKVCAAVKPADVIEEMWTHDVISLEWEIIRYRSLKSSVLKAVVRENLRHFLSENLNFSYEPYRDAFAEDIAERLLDVLPGNPTSQFVRKLAREYAEGELEAAEQVHGHLDEAEANRIMDAARDRAREALMQGHAQQDPDAIKDVNQILQANGRDMRGLMEDALVEGLSHHKDYLSLIERIDDLTADAESRRNVSLREIDRRRALFGEALRRSVQDIEDGKFEVIEAPSAKGKDAA